MIVIIVPDPELTLDPKPSGELSIERHLPFGPW
jgi:hypothetical protein